MKIDLFTLCDTVQCYENKLMVIGVYDVLLLQNITANPVMVSIAAHVVFDADECGESTFAIDGEDMENGNKVLSLKQPLNIVKRDKIGTGMLNVALSGVPVIFSHQGKYRFTLSVNGTGISEVVLNVIQAP